MGDVGSRVLKALAAAANPAFWRAQIGERQAKAFESRYGADVRVQVPVRDMQGVHPNLTRHAVHYEPSAIPKFRRAMGVVARRTGASLSEYSFVDIGSGKGLVVMLAARLPFRTVHGVEMAPELHRIAEANVRAFIRKEPRAAPITLACMDALQFALPSGKLVVYLYNPFDEELTARFVERLTRAAADRPAPMLIVYINPVHRRLLESNAFRALHDEPALIVYELALAPAQHQRR